MPRNAVITPIVLNIKLCGALCVSVPNFEPITAAWRFLRKGLGRLRLSQWSL
ncbi:hypothetical protein BDQ94DRAFT_155665 [Aspergillus welwitschiae]|uniref:Uncharacterized protein n=1 Tax=Aspergillus welwitschiae TaxID=1341132 RepID=A0A3F3PHH8_9EURO|nr:hypothetical protein BDQ94DRAFT_155665 [Aspergillus welwitschiae]RDH26369.1 hypothetical protein BDQ94DRAFT_155665 [Aspergillus welwitschiae]